MRVAFVVLPVILLVTASSLADSASPYAGQETREIKALSATEIADLIAGKGMGYAKAAELNGYPGPAHVLELADALQLTANQRAHTQAIFDGMAAAAKAVGFQIVETERALDESFRDRRVTPASLTSTLEALAALQARVRDIHLQAHLEQMSVLSPQQIGQYSALRGYHHGH
jgi:Spy/CpxP family protein refolding chaperone